MQEIISKKNILISLILIILVVATFLIFKNKSAEDIIPLQSELQMEMKCDIERYIDCNFYQNRSEEFCNTYYNIQNTYIENRRNRCLSKIEMFKYIENKNPYDCAKIADVDGYNDEGLIVMCYVLASENEKFCQSINEYTQADKSFEDKEQFCNLFFRVMKNDDFKEIPEFKVLDDGSKQFLILLKATRTGDYTLCKNIANYESEYTDINKLKCEILSKSPDSNNQSFCNKLDYCQNEII